MDDLHDTFSVHSVQEVEVSDTNSHTQACDGVLSPVATCMYRSSKDSMRPSRTLL